MKRMILFLITFILIFSTSVVFAKKHHRYDDTSGGGGGGLPQKISPPGRPAFYFSPRLLAWAAYDSNGNRAAHGRANGGSDYCADLGHRCHTSSGTFSVLSKGSASCKSTRFPIVKRHGVVVKRGGAEMPYCMFFTNNFAIHGHNGGLANANVSHGCIRVSTPAALWLRNFLHVGSKVVVLSY